MINDGGVSRTPRTWTEGAMPEDRPDVRDTRDVQWAWDCEEEAYSAYGRNEVCSWPKLLRLFGPVVEVLPDAPEPQPEEPLDEAQSITAMVREFHGSFGVAIDAADTRELRTLRAKLITEEQHEVWDALMSAEWEEDVPVLPVYGREHIAKELADLVYVCFGTAVSLGIDLDEAIRRVHASNMSKRNPDGTVSYREDGKVLKPSTYQPPDMAGVAPECPSGVSSVSPEGETTPGEGEAARGPLSREGLGRRVADICLKWSREDDDRPGAGATWETLDGRLRELYMRVGEALFSLGMTWSAAPTAHLRGAITEWGFRVPNEEGAIRESSEAEARRRVALVRPGMRTLVYREVGPWVEPPLSGVELRDAEERDGEVQP